jgi:hypothetical protein
MELSQGRVGAEQGLSESEDKVQPALRSSPWLKSKIPWGPESLRT